ncbi:MAG: hypothetical protein HXY26_02835 [Hydrogenophilaceae bacterium]|nr:hypothetical protein [Hydrogenophilaceae bacterium]
MPQGFRGAGLLKRVVIFLLTWLILGVSATAPALDSDATATVEQPVELYFFWSVRCPHCLEARPFVEALPARLPWLKLHSLELSHHPEHARLYVSMARQLGQEARAVPAFLFCGEMVVGWQSPATTGAFLLDRLEHCHGDQAKPAAGIPMWLPLLGEITTEQFSLPVFTALIAGLDAFNPCAFFVLLFLLSLLVHQRSRSRMLVIGGVFVLFSGLMYFMFMAAWLNLFQLLAQVAWVTAAAGGLAIMIALINIKDFFAFKRGVSLSIPESRKPRIYEHARAILQADNWVLMLAATVGLAVTANFYELLCTAGFPMVYTRLLTLHELAPATRYAYLGLYNLVYVIPLALIVLGFAYTLGGRKLSERQGRLLKLLSGLMMLELGGLLLLAPAWLDNPLTAVLLLLVAVGLTWLAAKLDNQRPRT